jgi:hypothetical protein
VFYTYSTAEAAEQRAQFGPGLSWHFSLLANLDAQVLEIFNESVSI